MWYVITAIISCAIGIFLTILVSVSKQKEEYKHGYTIGVEDGKRAILKHFKADRITSSIYMTPSLLSAKVAVPVEDFADEEAAFKYVVDKLANDLTKEIFKYVTIVEETADYDPFTKIYTATCYIMNQRGF